MAQTAKKLMMLNKKTKNKLDTFEQVYGYAMNLLNYRDYSSKDMLLKLKSKGASEEETVLSMKSITLSKCFALG